MTKGHSITCANALTREVFLVPGTPGKIPAQRVLSGRPFGLSSTGERTLEASFFDKDPRSDGSVQFHRISRASFSFVFFSC